MTSYQGDLINAIHLIGNSRDGRCPVLVVWHGNRWSWEGKKGVAGLPAGSNPRNYLGGFQISGLIIMPGAYVPSDHIEYILSRFRGYENGEVIMIMDHTHKECIRKILKRYRSEHPEYQDGTWELEAAMAKPYPFKPFKLKLPTLLGKESYEN